MVVGILKIELWLPENNSLKGKRMVIKGIQQRLRNSFNISISEVDYHDKWQRAILAVAAVGQSKRYIDGLLQQVLRKIESYGHIELVNHEVEIG